MAERQRTMFCLRLIVKHVVDFLLISIELFSLRVMAEELPATID